MNTYVDQLGHRIVCPDQNCECDHDLPCTAWVGGPDIETGDRCGEPAVVVSVDGESARCNDCLIWESQAGRPVKPLRMLN
jgi:hypothetical protein